MIKCETDRAFISFFAMSLINTIIQEQITLKSHFWRKSYYFVIFVCNVVMDAASLHENMVEPFHIYTIKG